MTAATQRPRLSYTPEWGTRYGKGSSIEETAKRISARNLWRTRPAYDMDDLMGEARMIFFRLCKKYPRVNNPRWMMRLFTTSFQRRIYTLANARTKRSPECAVSQLGGGGDSSVGLADLESGSHDGGLGMVELRLLLEDAPTEVLEVVRVMAPQILRGHPFRPVYSEPTYSDVELPGTTRRTFNKKRERAVEWLTQQMAM